MSKLNLVNPLNPNQIIKTEDINDQINNNINQNNAINQQNIVQNNNINNVVQPNNLENNSNINQSTNENNNSSNKKKLNLILIIVAGVIILGLIIGCFLFIKLNNSNNEVPKEPNTGNNGAQSTNKTLLNEIVKNFNKNVASFPLENNATVSAKVENDNIKVSIVYPNYVLHYDFPLTDRNLSSTIMKNDELAFKTTAYIISSISSYYGHDFNSTFNYINNNRNSLSNINTITITELEKLLIISFNIDNPVIVQ